MALIRMDHTPETVKVNLALNVIVPDPGVVGEIPVSQRKVLYLLHGLSEDASAWQRYTSIEAIAMAYGLVVVMPSAGRSFYTDLPNGQRYFTYLVEELPRYLEQVFDIPPRRENTLIAGTSMGGYGAFKAALLHPERYAAAASLSGVLSLAVLQMLPDDERKAEFAQVFGDLNKLPGSLHDPATWLHQAAASRAALPYLYISCGRQEDVFPLSVMFNAACQKLGVAVDYHEVDGRHEWPFWNRQIEHFLARVLGAPA